MPWQRRSEVRRRSAGPSPSLRVSRRCRRRGLRFEGSEEWYEQVARSRPPKNRPWYHVLPHASAHTTYVAERNLEPDDELEPIDHPMLSDFFEDFRDGRYVAARRVN